MKDNATERLRLGIVGTGAAARRCHLPAIAAGTAFRLTALVDRDIEHANQAAREYRDAAPGNDVEIVTDDLDTVLAHVDALVVATSHASHAALVDRVARGGKHVLVEKPLATTAADCDRIAAAADAGGVVVMPAHVRRLFPMAEFVRAMLTDGRLGRVHTVRWSEGRPYSWPLRSGFMFGPREAGGGLLADSGPHVFDMLLNWFGRDVELAGHADNSERGADSETATELRFAGGPTAHVELSRLRELANRCVLQGERGTLSVGTGVTADYELRDVDGVLVEGGAVPVLGAARAEWVALFQAQLDNFAGAIAGTAAPLATVADGAAVVRLVAAAHAGRSTSPLPRPWRWPSTPDVVPGGTLAVTGATGFIGSTTVERLVEGGGRAVAVVRDLARFARLSHLDHERVAPRRADVLDEDGLVAAFTGCDAVIHTVYGTDGGPDEQWRVGVEGGATVVRAAARAGARRVVHVGTVAVYQDPRGVVDESTPRIAVADDDRGYAAQKLAAERAVFAAGEAHGLEVVCVQPTVVYGPWGPSWTVRPIARLRAGAPELPAGDVGVCNAVHVADVADALLFAASTRLPAGSTVLVSAKEPVSWGRFYDAFRVAAGVPLPPSGVDLDAVGAWERPLYESDAVVAVDAAAAHGWQPGIAFDDGIEQVTAWARWAGLLP